MQQTRALHQVGNAAQHGQAALPPDEHRVGGRAPVLRDDRLHFGDELLDVVGPRGGFVFVQKSCEVQKV